VLIRAKVVPVKSDDTPLSASLDVYGGACGQPFAIVQAPWLGYSSPFCS
jgi:hypothetical protein